MYYIEVAIRRWTYSGEHGSSTHSQGSRLELIAKTCMLTISGCVAPILPRADDDTSRTRKRASKACMQTSCPRSEPKRPKKTSPASL
eukprot:scaffold436608_cov18-Prasinocladus_malaysianus.AAC.2